MTWGTMHVSKRTKWIIIVSGIVVVMLFGLFEKRHIFHMLSPIVYTNVVERYAAKYQLDPLLVLAVIKEESMFARYAVSSAGARGLMQIMPSTAKLLAIDLKMHDFDVSRLYEPEINVELGCYYLKNLLTTFHGNTLHAIAAYNAGETSVMRWLKEHPIDSVNDIHYGETRGFTARVLRNYRVLKTLRNIFGSSGIRAGKKNTV